MKVNFSKNGNLVYSGYIGIGTNGYYWADMRDRSFGAEMPTKEELLEEVSNLLEDLLRGDMEWAGEIDLPVTKLKPKKGYEIWEFEISKELTEEIMRFIEAGGKVSNA